MKEKLKDHNAASNPTQKSIGKTIVKNKNTITNLYIGIAMYFM